MLFLKQKKVCPPEREKGAITGLILVFGLIFLMLLNALLGFVLLELKVANKKISWAESLQIAEAGINYYRWCLNNGIEGSCELNRQYYDSSGILIGEFALEVNTAASCGETVSRDIVSSGWTEKLPNLKRKISVLYSRTSVAKYAYLLNDNVWAGADREIRGLYHSNGGIRMDGENVSLVTSAKDEWVCTDSFGCDVCPVDNGCRLEGSDCVCPGVFTTTDNSDPNLFDYPAPSFDFDGITIDLANIKSQAQSYSLYLPPSADIDPQARGYHLVFQNNGDVEVRIITSLARDWSYSAEDGWHYDYFRIVNEYSYATFSITSSCPVIFVEDNLWADGTVKGKITVASANLIDPNKDTDIILPGNINYVSADGSDGLALIGEKNILISPDSPDNMELYGIFIAQKGHFGRNLYYWNIKSKLEITGAIVSNGRVGTKWSSGSFVISGYLKRENYIDSNLIYNPPPFVPYAESDFKILRWRETE
jgi:hypothetical protein